MDRARPSRTAARAALLPPGCLRDAPRHCGGAVEPPPRRPAMSMPCRLSSRVPPCVPSEGQGARVRQEKMCVCAYGRVQTCPDMSGHGAFSQKWYLKPLKKEKNKQENERFRQEMKKTRKETRRRKARKKKKTAPAAGFCLRRRVHGNTAPAAGHPKLCCRCTDLGILTVHGATVSQ